MQNQLIAYKCDSLNLLGYQAKAKTQSPQAPAVLVVHAWKGQDDFARHKAEEFAWMGYNGFAVDLYGEGITAKDNKEAEQLMKPLFFNRQLLRERILAAYRFVAKQTYVDQHRIAVIGYCFGGLAALELLRSGASIRGAISFHGMLTQKIGDHQVDPTPIADGISGSLLMLHGSKDPLVPQQELLELQQELNGANIDWQLHVYGRALHAFTNPAANDRKHGLLYDATYDRRSWKSTTNFLHEIFSL